MYLKIVRNLLIWRDDFKHVFVKFNIQNIAHKILLDEKKRKMQRCKNDIFYTYKKRWMWVCWNSIKLFWETIPHRRLQMYFTFKVNCRRNLCKQESPPAWTQAAYSPPRSKYSFCFFIRGVPYPRMECYPIPGWEGDLAWGGGFHPRTEGCMPSLGTFPRVWRNKQTETITFPHPSDAGDKNFVHSDIILATGLRNWNSVWFI